MDWLMVAYILAALAVVQPTIATNESPELPKRVAAMLKAAKRHDEATFKRMVSANAKLRFEGHERPLSVDALADVVNRCELVGEPVSKRPKQYSAWTQVQLKCNGLDASYALFWFDDEDRVEFGVVAAPVPMPG